MKTTLTLLALSASAFAQSTIAPAQSFAWGANVGWLDARPDAAFGVRTADMVCSGYAWSANVGWINLGDPSFHYLYTGAMRIPRAIGA